MRGSGAALGDGAVGKENVMGGQEVLQDAEPAAGGEGEGGGKVAEAAGTAGGKDATKPKFSKGQRVWLQPRSPGEASEKVQVATCATVDGHVRYSVVLKGRIVEDVSEDRLSSQPATSPIALAETAVHVAPAPNATDSTSAPQTAANTPQSSHARGNSDPGADDIAQQAPVVEDEEVAAQTHDVGNGAAETEHKVDLVPNGERKLEKEDEPKRNSGQGDSSRRRRIESDVYEVHDDDEDDEDDDDDAPQHIPQHDTDDEDDPDHDRHHDRAAAQEDEHRRDRKSRKHKKVKHRDKEKERGREKAKKRRKQRSHDDRRDGSLGRQRYSGTPPSDDRSPARHGDMGRDRRRSRSRSVPRARPRSRSRSRSGSLPRRERREGRERSREREGRVRERERERERGKVDRGWEADRQRQRDRDMGRERQHRRR